MIRVQIVTEILFKDHADLDGYLTSPELERVTGFAQEIRIAQRTKKPYVFSTPRLDYGAVVKSEITVDEV